MKYLKLYEDYVSEKLGISKEVNAFVLCIYNIIFSKINISINIFNDINIDFTDKIEIPYKNIFNFLSMEIIFDNNFNFEANVETIDDKLIIKLNSNVIKNHQNLLGLLFHEIQHIYTEKMGLNTSIDYKEASKLLTLLDGVKQHYPNTINFLNMIYYSSPTEIYAHIHELFFNMDVKNNIKTNMDFKSYLSKNGLWKYTTNLGKRNINDVWQDVID